VSDEEQFEPAAPRPPMGRRLQRVAAAFLALAGLLWSAGAVLTSGGVFAGCVVAAVLCYALAWGVWPPRRQ